MSCCAVYGCSNTHRKCKGKVKFFRFPKDSERRGKWILACRRRDQINVDAARVCSDHFKEDAFAKTLRQQMLNYSPKSGKKLSDDAVPTLRLPGISDFEDMCAIGKKRPCSPVKRKLIDPLVADNISCSLEEPEVFIKIEPLEYSSDEDPMANEFIIDAKEELIGWKMKAAQLKEENNILKIRIHELEAEVGHLRANYVSKDSKDTHGGKTWVTPPTVETDNGPESSLSESDPEASSATTCGVPKKRRLENILENFMKSIDERQEQLRLEHIRTEEEKKVEKEEKERKKEEEKKRRHGEKLKMQRAMLEILNRIAKK